MATLSRQGTEIARLDFLTCRRSYRSNGYIMVNRGDGWKLEKRLKKEFIPQAAEKFSRIKQLRKDRLSKFPFFIAYESLLHELVSLKHRWRVNCSIELMPDDPDGVWSTFDDYSWSSDYPSLSIDDCVKLCEAYRLYQGEIKEQKQAS